MILAEDTFMAQDQLGPYVLGEKLGEGGNGAVWRTELEGRPLAIKVLKRHDRVDRFCDEVEAMRRLAGIEGVLPIVDANVPKVPTKSNRAWFVMPLAEPLLKVLGGESQGGLSEIVSAMRDIAIVLSRLHELGFAHRDIKPDNLFFFDGRWCIGDLGLIEFEGKSHVTARGEKIGPLHFIAPEMLIGADNPNDAPADVFSLAKTLWVLATGMRYPLPGPYIASVPVCQISQYVAANRTVLLDKLIEHCTAMDRTLRPTMRAVAEELTAWLSTQSADQHPDELKLGPDWQEVANKVDVERLGTEEFKAARERQTKVVNDLALRALAVLFSPLKKLLEKHLAHVDVSGGGNTASFTGRMPVRTDPSRSVSLDVRIWILPDWGNPAAPTCNSSFAARMLIRDGQSSSTEDLFKDEMPFMLEGPGQEAMLARYRSEVRGQLGGWLEAMRQRWVDLD